MNIDWSKQPEGFPIWIETNDGIGGGWHRDDGYRYTAQDLTYWTKPADGYYIAHTRPAWTGEGLPPVGTVCEYRCGYVEQPHRHAECTVIAHFVGESGATLAAFTYVAHDGLVQLGRGSAGLFRPVLTPEQISAEERQAAIKQICIDAGSPEMTPGQLTVAGKLYDAGYRKFEIVDVAEPEIQLTHKADLKSDRNDRITKTSLI